MRTFVFAGGGTGGHIAPGLAVAETLEGLGHRVVFVTSGREIEGRFLAGGDRAVHRLPIEREGERGWRNARLLLRWFAVARRARTLLAEVRPDVVVGTGGRVTWFALRAARRAGVRTALLEVNAEPGRAVRWMERRVDRVLCGFERTRERLRVPERAVVTGVPIRSTFVAAPLPTGARARLLILGGSQGSRLLNDVAIHLARTGGEILELDHVSGDRDHGRCAAIRADCAPEIRARWSLVAFADDLPVRLRACDLVLGRAGASTVAEVCAAHRPAVFVPYPHHDDDHQAWNARALGEGMCLHRDTDGIEAIAATVAALLTDRARRERMVEALGGRPAEPRAAERAAAELLAMVPQ